MLTKQIPPNQVIAQDEQGHLHMAFEYRQAGQAVALNRNANQLTEGIFGTISIRTLLISTESGNVYQLRNMGVPTNPDGCAFLVTNGRTGKSFTLDAADASRTLLQVGRDLDFPNGPQGTRITGITVVDNRASHDPSYGSHLPRSEALRKFESLRTAQKQTPDLNADFGAAARRHLPRAHQAARTAHSPAPKEELSIHGRGKITPVKAGVQKFEAQIDFNLSNLFNIRAGESPGQAFRRQEADVRDRIVLEVADKFLRSLARNLSQQPGGPLPRPGLSTDYESKMTGRWRASDDGRSVVAHLDLEAIMKSNLAVGGPEALMNARRGLAEGVAEQILGCIKNKLYGQTTTRSVRPL